MTKLEKSGAESARRGSTDAKPWTVIVPIQKRRLFDAPLASEIDVLRPELLALF